jgi:long-chain acyl-CoA synthetase
MGVSRGGSRHGDAARPWTAFYGPHAPEIETAPSHPARPDRRRGRDLWLAPAFTCVPAQRDERHASASRRSTRCRMRWRSTCARWRAWARATGWRCRCPIALSFPVAAFAVFKAGCVLVNVNPLYTAEEMASSSRMPSRMRSSSSTCSPTRSPPPRAATRSPTSSSPAWRSSFRPAPGHRGAGAEILGPLGQPIEVPHIRLPDAIAAGRAHRARTMSRSAYSSASGPPTMSPCCNIPAARRACRRARC